MWILTRGGRFFSVVQKPWDKDLDTLTVRARRREDLEYLLQYDDRLVIIDSPGADYPFRVNAPKDLMASVMAHEVIDIDYSNFKATVADDKRHGVLLDVWSALRRLNPVRFTRPAESDHLPLSWDEWRGLGKRDKRGKGKNPPLPFTDE